MPQRPSQVAQFWRRGHEQEIRDEITGYLSIVVNQNFELRREEDLALQVRSIAAKLAPAFGDSEVSPSLISDDDAMGFFTLLAEVLSDSDQTLVEDLLILEIVRVHFPNFPEDTELMERVRAIQ